MRTFAIKLLLAGVGCVVLAGCMSGPDPAPKSSRGYTYAPAASAAKGTAAAKGAAAAKGTGAARIARQKSSAGEDIPPASQLNL